MDLLHPPEPASNLPAPAPELTLLALPSGRIEVRGISEALTAVLGLEVDAVVGREVQALFADAVPSLTELVREALQSEAALADIPLCLVGGGTQLLATVAPGGLTDDYRGRLVQVYFRLPAVADQPRATGFAGLVGQSPALREVFRKIRLYAPSDAAVVVTGETGTGKELVARALHDQSERAAGPFVAVNCTAISGELLESELFGHEKGAFTGAVRTHRGRFERADGGTLFLDEVGDMPLQTQAKLLRVLETGTIERVGAESEKKVDVRVVCATHVPLEQAVGQGRFRSDLYHRLSVLRVHLPPLRQRTEDIALLVGHFLASFNGKYGRRIERLTPEALALLQSYQWPGNIRELRNVLERVYIETAAEVIGARAFAEWVCERQDFAPGDWGGSTAPGSAVAPPYPLASERPLLSAPAPGYLEAELLPDSRHRHTTRPADLDVDEIKSAYRAAEGNLAGAARLLGVHRATLYRYLKKLGISRDDLG